MFKVGDEVVRLFNNKVYKVSKIEECGSILIVRSTSPSKTWGTWVNPNEIKHIVGGE